MHETALTGGQKGGGTFFLHPIFIFEGEYEVKVKNLWLISQAPFLLKELTDLA